MAKIFLMIKAWKINISFAALLKGDHLVSARWGFWTPRTQGHFSYVRWSLDEQPVWPWDMPAASQRGALPVAHKLAAARGLSICSMGAPRVASKLVGRLPPSFWPVVLTSSHLQLCPPAAAHALQPGQLLDTQPNSATHHTTSGFPDAMLQMFPSV